MRTFPMVLGVFFVLAGVVWILQAFDVAFAPGSFMTGDRKWVLYGALTVASGVVLIEWARRSG